MMSIPQASMGTLQAPRLVTQSAMVRAVPWALTCLAMVSRSLMTPVEVSEWVKITALMALLESASRAVRNASGSRGEPHSALITSTSRP